LSRIEHVPIKAKERRTKETEWFDLVAIGASAGGLPALSEVLAGIGPSFPAVVVVQHLDPRHKSLLAGLLSRKTARPVKEAEDGERISPNTVYIGPPDQHLLVTQGKIQLAHSRLIRFSRPSIDVMFGSVAATCRDRAIGVILSGSNRDGSDGICAIHGAGGVTLAQEPSTAEFRVMPQAAIDTGCVDHVVRLNAMGRALAKLFVEGKVRK
jgi:two-component system chemotaxis response regulator CheB